MSCGCEITSFQFSCVEVVLQLAHSSVFGLDLLPKSVEISFFVE